MKKPRLGLLTAVWQRETLTDFVLGYYARQRVRVEPIVDLQMVACGSEGGRMREICERNGFRYVHHPNRPLGAKWNHGLAAMADLDIDGVVIVGSDDIVSDAAYDHYQDAIQRGVALLGFIDMFFLDLLSWKSCHWHGYTEGPRAGEPVGAGRFVSRSVLDALGWRPWRNDLDSSLDRSFNQNVRRVLGPADAEGNTHWTAVASSARGAVVVDLKSDQNIWSWEQISSTPGVTSIAPAEVLRGFPEEDVAALRALAEAWR